jgi:hypothetical protein
LLTFVFEGEVRLPDGPQAYLFDHYGIETELSF